MRWAAKYRKVPSTSGSWACSASRAHSFPVPPTSTALELPRPTQPPSSLPRTADAKQPSSCCWGAHAYSILGARRMAFPFRSVLLGSYVRRSMFCRRPANAPGRSSNIGTDPWHLDCTRYSGAASFSRNWTSARWSLRGMHILRGYPLHFGSPACLIHYQIRPHLPFSSPTLLPISSSSKGALSFLARPLTF